MTSFFSLRAQCSPSSKGQPPKALHRRKREQAPYQQTPGANPAENGHSYDADQGSLHYPKPTATDYATTTGDTQHRVGPEHALYT